MRNLNKLSATAIALATFFASPASAHFKLLKPTSWLKEDSGGNPQKGGPCGPGGLDDVQPVPASSEITTFHAGEKITVQWTDTIAHPGHFRIALAQDRKDLKDPDIQQDSFCGYDESKLVTGAHGNVLADGVSFRPSAGFNAPAGTMFSTEVTLPDMPCDKCTLQVMQVMEMDLQSLSNCHYYHCADIKIVASGTSAGAGGSGGASGSSSVAGTSAGAAGGSGTAAAGGGGAVAAGAGGQAGASGMRSTTGAAGVPAVPVAGTASVAGVPVISVTSAGVGAATPLQPTTGTTAGGQAVTAAPLAPVSGTNAATTPPTAASSTSSGGCSVRAPAHQSVPALLVTGLIAGLSLVSRRRRHRIGH